MSGISLLALLGLVAIGFSNPTLTIPFSFILIWLIASIKKGREFHPPPILEAAVVFIGFFLFIFLETPYEVHLFVRLGNGLAIIQLLRMFRSLNHRERIASIVISFVHIAVSTQVIVGPIFILILLSFACLFPSALKELFRGEKIMPRKVARDCLALVVCASILFFLFPRGFLPQQRHLRIPLTFPIPVPEFPTPEADPLVMLIEGEELSYIRLFIASIYKDGRWQRKPESQEESPVSSPRYPANKLLERRIVVMDIAQLGGFLPHDGKIVSAEGNYFREFYLTPVGDYRVADARLTGPGRISYSILAAPSRISLSPDELEFYTRLPPLTPKAFQMVSEITEGIENQEEKIYRMISFLLATFEYVEVAPRRNMSFGEFLWVTKKGSCVDFAGALAMMARISGIPSRVVAGFRLGMTGGETGRYKIHRSDGHAWTEIYLKEKGWVSFDATPPCPHEIPLPHFFTPIMSRIRDIWYWNIVAFSFPEQEIILRRTSLFLREFPLFSLGVLALLGLMLFLLKRKLHLFKRGSSRNSIKRLFATKSKIDFYTHMNKLLSRLGYRRLPNETPLEFARRIREEKLPMIEEVELLSWYFCKVKYGGESLTSHMQDETKNSLLRIKELVPAFLRKNVVDKDLTFG